MKKNNKGITLVELLTVLIILIVIFLLAIVKINDAMDDAEIKSVKADAISYVKAVNDIFIIKNGLLLFPAYEGLYTYSELSDMGVNVSGTKPIDGYILNINNKTVYGCLKYKDRRAIIENDKVVSVDTKKCKLNKGYNSDMKVYLAEYTGGEQTFTIPISGKYKLEVWGAQGGSLNETYFGGYGGYSYGFVDLEKDDILYINVGGSGINLNNVVNGWNNGGYNGGGKGYSVTTNCSNFAGSGGGATSIATKSGILSSLSEDIDKILIVAGGGGGAVRRHCNDNDYGYENGGSGGGYIGGSRTVLYTKYSGEIALGGSQTSGGYAGRSGTESGIANGSFGKGGETTRTGGYTNSSGGGGGFYGGGNGMFVGASGGSGYIGNDLLTNKFMYCYHCNESSNDSIKTISTDNVSETPVTLFNKKGNGYARIILYEENNSNN